MKNYDDHSDEEANGKHDDADYHPRWAKRPFAIHKVVSGGSEDDARYKGLCGAETSSQAGQVAARQQLFLHCTVNQEENSGDKRGDETQDVDDAGEANKNSCEDDRGGGDHQSTQSGKPARQVGPVWEEDSQEDVPHFRFHHAQDQGHSDAENPDKFTPDTPRTHHPSSGDDDDEG
ncbi:hypothetical protein ABVT39_015188 [Epinephelus coioides]